jgi:phage terminase large subunit-like protein
MRARSFEAGEDDLLAIPWLFASDRTSVCWEQRAYAERVLAGIVEDDSLFGYVATIDPGDDWHEESAWRKANPNLGVSVKLDYLERRAARAMKMPGAQNSFRRLHLDEWTDAAEAWLSVNVWEAVQASTLDLSDHRGSSAWLAVDLSSKRDLTVLLVVVETENDQGDELLLAFPRFWMPADGVLERSERDGVDYATWRDQGLITATPGAVVDVAHVAAAIAELAEELDIRGVVGDAYRRYELQAALEELGCTVPLIDHPQGYRKAAGSDLWMPGSVDATEKAILERKIRIAASPVLTWNVGSVCMVADAQENRKPNKLKSTGRIDGALALIMAVGAVLRSVPAERQPDYQLLFV